MTREEARVSLAKKLNIDPDDLGNNGLFSESDLNEFIEGAAQVAWDRHSWSFTEGDWAVTIDGIDIPKADYYDYPEDAEDESIHTIYVDGEEFTKKVFTDYRRLLNLDPTNSELIWSEHKRFYFVNGNAYSAGVEFLLLGKIRFPGFTDDTDRLPFSPSSDNQENSGNRAIVQLAFGEALASEKLKKYKEGDEEQKKGLAKLDAIWKPIGERRANAQHTGRPLFEVPNMFGRQRPEIGNF